MEELNGITIYWLISIGLLIGYIIYLIMGRRGMHMAGNLAGGIIGSLAIGAVAIYLELSGTLLYACVGTVSFLFLVNIFSTHVRKNSETYIAKS